MQQEFFLGFLQEFLWEFIHKFLLGFLTFRLIPERIVFRNSPGFRTRYLLRVSSGNPLGVPSGHFPGIRSGNLQKYFPGIHQDLFLENLKENQKLFRKTLLKCILEIFQDLFLEILQNFLLKTLQEFLGNLSELVFFAACRHIPNNPSDV